MKTIWFLFAGALCIPIALASPACVPGSLADYIALGTPGCDFNGVSFTNFRYAVTESGATASQASSITVAPAASLQDVLIWNEGRAEQVYGIGFDFGVYAFASLDRPESRSAELVMDIMYQATSAAAFRAAFTLVVLGGGTSSTALELTYISGQACSYFTNLDVRQPACSFSPTHSISVDHYMRVSVGSPGGAASIHTLQSGMVTTPEPAGWLLCCATLLMLAGVAQARRRSKG